MAIAAYKDLCIDANDAAQVGRFWSHVLGLTLVLRPNGDAQLTGATKQHTVWINAVPEPKQAKHRMHLDVRGTRAELVSHGAAVVDNRTFPWVVMVDPEGGEFCVFDEAVDASHGVMRNVVFDTADPVGIATWWAEVLGATVEHGAGASSVNAVDGAPFDSLHFVPVPEPKSVKNRLHIDVTCETLELLIAAGATMLRAHDREIRWNVLADPDGNEFCAFVN